MARPILVLAIAAVLLAAGTAQGTPDKLDTSRPITRFLTWLADNGVDTSYFSISPAGDHGYGLFATKDLPLGDGGRLLLAVPEFLTISPSTLPDSPVLQMLKPLEERANVGCDAQTVLLTMYERFYNPNSFWAPYFDMLPKSFPDLPVLFTGADAELVAASFQLRFQIASSINLYRVLEREMRENVFMKNPQVFGEDTEANRNKWAEELEWAFHIVGTRLFSDQTTVCKLVPLGDIANHKFGAPAIGQLINQDQTRTFGFGQNKDIKAGEEIFVSYEGDDSPKCDFQLAAQYGFIADDPTHSCSQLSLNINVPALSGLKQGVLRQLKLLNEQDQLVVSPIVTSGRPAPRELIAASRIAAADDADMGHAQLALEGPLSLMSELNLLRSLIRGATMLQDETRRSRKAVLDKYGLLDESTWTPRIRLLSKLHRDDIEGLEVIKQQAVNQWVNLLNSDYNESWTRVVQHVAPARANATNPAATGAEAAAAPTVTPTNAAAVPDEKADLDAATGVRR